MECVASDAREVSRDHCSGRWSLNTIHRFIHRQRREPGFRSRPGRRCCGELCVSRMLALSLNYSCTFAFGTRQTACRTSFRAIRSVPMPGMSESGSEIDVSRRIPRASNFMTGKHSLRNFGCLLKSLVIDTLHRCDGRIVTNFHLKNCRYCPPNSKSWHCGSRRLTSNQHRILRSR